MQVERSHVLMLVPFEAGTKFGIGVDIGNHIGIDAVRRNGIFTNMVYLILF